MRKIQSLWILSEIWGKKKQPNLKKQGLVALNSRISYSILDVKTQSCCKHGVLGQSLPCTDTLLEHCFQTVLGRGRHASLCQPAPTATDTQTPICKSYVSSSGGFYPYQKLPDHTKDGLNYHSAVFISTLLER